MVVVSLVSELPSISLEKCGRVPVEDVVLSVVDPGLVLSAVVVVGGLLEALSIPTTSTLSDVGVGVVSRSDMPSLGSYFSWLSPDLIAIPDEESVVEVSLPSVSSEGWNGRSLAIDVSEGAKVVTGPVASIPACDEDVESDVLELDSAAVADVVADVVADPGVSPSV